MITIDDDILYRNTMLEFLLKYHEIFPEAVIARNVSFVTCNTDGTIAPYKQWSNWCGTYVGIPRNDLLAKTGSGTLYLPRLFNAEVFNTSVFMEKCQYADDIWMKIMEIYSGIPVVLAECSWEDSILEEHQKNCLFTDYNCDGGNDEQLKTLLGYYLFTANGKKTLMDSIFENGKIYCTQAKEMERQEMKYILERLMGTFEPYKKILIYGAGKTGNRVCRLLLQNEPDMIKAFIVDDIVHNPVSVSGICVKDYRVFVNTDENIIIALYDRNEAEAVKDRLIKEGVMTERLILLDNITKRALWYMFDEGGMRL